MKSTSPPRRQEGLILKLLCNPWWKTPFTTASSSAAGAARCACWGRREGEQLYFAVIDNGPGMSEERLLAVIAGLGEEDASTGYGLSNVDPAHPPVLRPQAGPDHSQRPRWHARGIHRTGKEAGRRCIRYFWWTMKLLSAKASATVFPWEGNGGSEFSLVGERRMGNRPANDAGC